MQRWRPSEAQLQQVRKVGRPRIRRAAHSILSTPAAERRSTSCSRLTDTRVRVNAQTSRADDSLPGIVSRATAAVS